MGKKNRTGKRLRLVPLILGGYGAFLGLGLAVIGLAEIKEGIGIARFLMGIGMAGFGLLGIWDGVRDLVKPGKKPGQAPTIQFILTDTSGNRSSLVTPEVLREQMGILAESEEPKRFDIQILPPLPVGEHGLLKQLLCIYHGNIILVAFFEIPKGGYRIYQKNTEPDMAVEWLKQLLAGSPDFSEWKNIEPKSPQDEGDTSQNEDNTGWKKVPSMASIHGHEADTYPNEAYTCPDEAYTCPDEAYTCPNEADTLEESVETFWQQLLVNQKGQMAYWHQLLVIFGESWHDEHKFFSSRDVELAVEGIYEGKYTKVVLEWGTKAFDLFPGVQNDLMVIWCTNNTKNGNTRFLAREGTVTQVKFWLVNYLNHGFFEEMSGWADITAQIENAKRKDEKKHGKIF